MSKWEKLIRRLLSIPAHEPIKKIYVEIVRDVVLEEKGNEEPQENS